MYTGHGFNDWGIGDVDVIKVGDTYHLFHLFLPNHAYIAHAISKDGLTWTRVPNALFVGDPGAWDDDMLWTMHVSTNPHKPGTWQMFYTGLSRREAGLVQRIGRAISNDLYNWTKVTDGYPILVSEKFYETSIDEGRQWISCRDPFYCRVNNEGWLLASARVNNGPIIRRGCVALAKEVKPNHFEFGPPLHFPRLYDDVEVPGLVQMNGRTYLIGSIREDVKVRYWYANSPEGPFTNPADNSLLPQGNYAARICNEENRFTLWNFYYIASKIKGTGNMLPPPKELVTSPDGLLKLKSFSGFDDKVIRRMSENEIRPLKPFHDNPNAEGSMSNMAHWFSSESAYEMFLFVNPARNFRVRFTFQMHGEGKCGLVLRMNEQTDGYYISLDLHNGLVQARAWGHNPKGGIETAFQYELLQDNSFKSKGGNTPYQMELIAFGSYIEFSLDGYVLLSFVDDRYTEGSIGYYTEGARVHTENGVFEELEEPQGESYSTNQ